MSYTSITQLRARIMVLEAALQPFAHEDFCRTLGGNGHGDDSVIFQRREAVITLGDCRRAHAILNPTEPATIDEKVDEAIARARLDNLTITHYFGGDVKDGAVKLDGDACCPMGAVALYCGLTPLRGEGIANLAARAMGWTMDELWTFVDGYDGNEWAAVHRGRQRVDRAIYDAGVRAQRFADPDSEGL